MPVTRTDIFFQVLRDYMVQTSLHGYQYLAEPGRHWFERLMWTVVHIASTSCLLMIVYGMYVDYYNQLPVTTIKSIYHPIKEVPYPGIAFCDINKLRKSKTLELASSLYAEYNVSVSEERLGQLLRYLGLLYDQSEQINSETIIRELDEVLTVAKITLNITQVMETLSTPCDELLIKCKWESRDRPCGEMFQSRKTMEGFCCTFNYIRPTDDFNPTKLKMTKEPQKSPTAGPHMGLTVLVHSNLSEYYYPIIPVIGLKVLIFNPHDYPDTGSGGLTELLVAMKQEVFFSLSSVTTQATELVHDLHLDRRSCYFNSDIEEKFGDLYSYSDCMMDCRVEDMRKRCGCLPFYSPSRDIWQTMKPHSPIGGQVGSEGNVCPNPCYPSCTSTLYTVQSSNMPLSQKHLAKSSVYPTVETENHSIVHIYFGSPSTPLMTTDVLTTWFELLSMLLLTKRNQKDFSDGAIFNLVQSCGIVSYIDKFAKGNIGGVCGAFVGFSLMSIIEFVYFFTVRLALEAFDRHRLQRAVHLAEVQRKECSALEIGPSNAKIYTVRYGWSDPYPKSRDLNEDTENEFHRRAAARSSSVQIFWNEISLPKNSKNNPQDAVY